MTVPVQTPYSNSVGNGVTTVFAYTFLILSSSDLVVKVAGATKVLGVDFTISGVGGTSGGAVTFLVAPANLAAVTLYRSVALTRTFDYQSNGDFLAPTVNADFDRLWLALQDAVTGASSYLRALRAPVGEVLADIPAAAARANGIQAYDALGVPIIVPGQAGSASTLAIDLANAALSTKGAGQIGFGKTIVYGAGTAGAKLRERVSVLDYGAVADGNYTTGAGTDNSAAFQAAINSLPTTAGGGEIFIPKGVYKLTTQITIPDGVQLVGTGKWTSILFCPNAFSNAGGLVASSVVATSPTGISGVGVLAQLGGCTGAAIVSTKNGFFVRDVWVNGFATGVTLSNTDNFLTDFAIEVCTTGIAVGESDVNVSNGVVYGCAQGALVSNNAGVGGLGTVVFTGVRATQCSQSGFIVSNGRNVQIVGCSADHVNNGQFTTGGIVVDTSSEVTIIGFVGKLGGVNPSTIGVGIKCLNGSTNIVISGCKLTGWLDGISQSGCTGVAISGNMSKANGRYGINDTAGDQISITGNNCSNNGTLGSAIDAGINSVNSTALAIHSIVGNVCTQAGGGFTEYGIAASISGSGSTLIVGNVCQFNGTADLLLSGTGVANIRCAQNTIGTFSDTVPTLASAAALTLPTGADFLSITGTTNITSIVATGNARRTVTLAFVGILTVTDGANLKLAGNFVTTADDTITLYCDGTSWFEVARAIN